MMIEKLKEYLETELHYAKVGLEKEINPKHRSDICWYATQRGLGACQFLDFVDDAVNYQQVEDLFNWYKAELEVMESAVC